MVEKKAKNVGAPSKEVAVKPSQPLTPNTAFEAHAGEGLEHVTANDLLIPRLSILQSMSDQLKPKKAVYVEGAKVGDICNLGTGELMEPPLHFLPIHYAKQWLEWNGDIGEGLAAIHNDASILDMCERDDDGHFFRKDNGHPVQETAQFFGINLASRTRAFIGLKSTELKKAKKWLTLATSEKAKKADGTEYTPALFYRTYELSISEEGNAKGDWYGWKIDRGPRLEELEDWQNLLKDALAFRDSIKKGEVRSDISSMGEEQDKELASEKAM